VSHKSPRIADLLADLPDDPGPHGLPRHYAGFFHCFNQGLYFEAHDVLEELWLAGGKTGENYAFYKGLIQWAGAFVHLQKGRLRPAVALFDLAATNLPDEPLGAPPTAPNPPRILILLSRAGTILVERKVTDWRLLSLDKQRARNSPG
jgi:hypothetical protein